MEQPTDTSKGATQRVGSVTLKPGETERLELGLYNIADEPKFRIAYEPDLGDAIVYDDSKLTDGTVYIPVYEFQNLGRRTCTVTVWWIGGGDRLR